MVIREPIVAGQFYPADPAECRRECDALLALGEPTDTRDILGGVVPHAGWFFSGATAGRLIGALRRARGPIRCVVLLGAVHRARLRGPTVGQETHWRTPLGLVPVERERIDRILEIGAASLDRSAHQTEHSLEVVVPLIQAAFPDASIVPVLSPPTAEAIELGRRLAELFAPDEVTFVASTDLTHYGPSYGFMPMGPGRPGLEWAYRVNDREFLDCVVRLDPDGVLAHAAAHASACGAGAVAAAVAWARCWGVREVRVLEHTTSNRVLQDRAGRTGADSVGYASVAFIRPEAPVEMPG